MLIYFISAFRVLFLCGIIIMWHRTHLSSTHSVKICGKIYQEPLTALHELLRVYGLLNKNISILAVEHHKLINLTFRLFSWGHPINFGLYAGYFYMIKVTNVILICPWFFSASIKMITNKYDSWPDGIQVHGHINMREEKNILPFCVMRERRKEMRCEDIVRQAQKTLSYEFKFKNFICLTLILVKLEPTFNKKNFKKIQHLQPLHKIYHKRNLFVQRKRFYGGRAWNLPPCVI